jgi:hypothetical protein
MPFRLTPPSQLIFSISVAHANIAIPNVTQTNFVTLLIAYLVLLAGNLFEGI